MKSSVTITLIICGTILILAPIISNMVGTALVAETMEELQKSINLKSDLPGYYDKACITSGITMIAVGTLVPLRSKRTP